MVKLFPFNSPSTGVGIDPLSTQLVFSWGWGVGFIKGKKFAEVLGENPEGPRY